jgi:hypothetical protein
MTLARISGTDCHASLAVETGLAAAGKINAMAVRASKH